MKYAIDETELARLEELAKHVLLPFETVMEYGVGCPSGNGPVPLQVCMTRDKHDARYIATACNAVPALVAEVRRLRRNYECSEKSLQRHEHMVAELMEKVEEWEWCNQVQHIYDNISFVLGLRQCAINELYTTLTAAREAVHADR